MPSKRDITRHIMMDVLMTERPEIIPVLLKRKMHCVGCLLASFHSVADAAYEHDIDEAELLEALQSANKNDAPRY